MIFLRLFIEFFRAGLFAVGGGLATLPFLYDISTRTGWFTHAQLADMVAVSESTPGPIGVNMATYVGFTTAGLPGAVIATLGLITPSVIVILLVAQILDKFQVLVEPLCAGCLLRTPAGVHRTDRRSAVPGGEDRAPECEGLRSLRLLRGSVRPEGHHSRGDPVLRDEEDQSAPCLFPGGLRSDRDPAPVCRGLRSGTKHLRKQNL